VDDALEETTRRFGIEVRGIFYQAIKNVFPHIAEIVPPELGKHFEKEIDPGGWYNAEPYVATVEYLLEHISPQVMVLLGNELTEVGKREMLDMGITSTEEFAQKLNGLYPQFVRGAGTGAWVVEEYRPGRMVIKETGIVRNISFILGVLKSLFSAFEAVNIRITVLDEREKGAEFNRFLIEWIESNSE
jgi:hypothetical protein